MGIFSTKELSDSQSKKLNELLPEQFRKENWSENDFKVPNHIYQKIENLYNSSQNQFNALKKELYTKTDDYKEIEVRNIGIFNTEVFNAEPLGMVDIGSVEKFGAASTGDRFANGAIGYAIESAIDKTWASGNIQENAVNNVKYKLLQKAKSIFPECNLLFKYEVDFREIGSSGNVFIYMRVTASKGTNNAIKNAQNKAQAEIDSLKTELENKKQEVEKLFEIKSKVPPTFKDVEGYLGV